MNARNKQGKKSSKSATPRQAGSQNAGDEDLGYPRIDLDLKLEEDISAFIRFHVEQQLKDEDKRASFRLTKRRITEIYETLMEAGFSRELVESAMLQCLPVGGDLVMTLDWLCLNTKDEDLPENFSQVLKVEEQKLRQKFIPVESRKKEEVVGDNKEDCSPSVELNGKHSKSDDKDADANLKDWIMQYAEAESEDDEDEDVAGSASDALNGKMCLDDKLNEKFITLVAKYMDLKSSARSKSAERDLKSLIKEMKALRSKPGFDSRNRGLLNLEAEMQNIQTNKNEEDEYDVGGLFDRGEEEEEEGGRSRNAAKLETKKPSPPAKDSEVRDFSYTKQQWTGKSPKQFLLDWMRKKMKNCSFTFDKVECGAGKWRSRCILKRPAKEGGDLSVCPEILSLNIKDAEHLASTLLLYTLCKDKDLHLLLPPPYRDVWLDWKRSEKMKVETSAKEGTKGRDAFVDKLFNKINNSRSVCSKNKNDAGGDDDDCWEKRADEELFAAPSLSSAPSPQTSSSLSSSSSDSKRKLLADCKHLMESNRKSKTFQNLVGGRESLPIHNFRQEIVEVFRRNSVFVIAGETGSGKSTQVPQFILEELMTSSTHSPPLVVCTEPRRISAVSLAHRVSAEMGESGEPGSSKSLCGYQIRSKVKKSSSTRLLFCTTGVLLRRMQEDLKVEDIGCIIIDEVHERDLNTDVMLIHLLELLTSRQRRSELKVVLMSATLDCNKFSDYFFKCPVISVKGRSHPVEVLHLEHILELTRYRLESDSPYSLPYEDIVQEESTRLRVTGKGGETKDIDVTWSKKDIYAIDNSGLDTSKFSFSTRNTLTRMNCDLINVDLILETLRWLFVADNRNDDVRSEMVKGREGSVLVFLPGLAAIEEVRDMMNSDPVFSDLNKFLVLPLHSVLSSDEQASVFSAPPIGARKIILSTNIAETGVTIPDVVYVIDSGREKQKKYMESSRISQLRQVWISVASSLQRQGRAGRVRPGVCLRLYTSGMHSMMNPQTLPEMKRLPLQGLCLHIMKCYSRPASEILSKAIDPPLSSAVSTAMSILQETGACIGPKLTPLGHHLARLPLDARLGKMLIYAGVLGCLEQASLMVSCMTEKSPFQSRLEQTTSLGGGKNQFDDFNSDQLATYLAVRRGLALKTRMERLAYCRKNSLKFDVLKDIETSAKELQQVVSECGLELHLPDILKSNPNLLRAFSLPSVDPKPPTVALLKAVLVAGLYPNVGRLVVDEKAGRKRSCEVRLGSSGEASAIHHSSVNKKPLESGWIVYLNKEKQDRVSISDTTLVGSLPLLLFGGNIQVQHQQHLLLLDNWMKFKAPAKVGVLMKEMRLVLDDFLDRKLHDPRLDVSGEPVLPLLLRMLAEGK